MYHLLVSHNCGITYTEAARGETITELEEKIVEVNNQGLRWVVENDAGDIQTDLVCEVFAKIFESPFSGNITA